MELKLSEAYLSGALIENTIGLDKKQITETVEINITDKEINDSDLKDLEKAINNLMLTVGYELKEEGITERGSIFKKLIFQSIKYILSDEKEKAFKKLKYSLLNAIEKDDLESNSNKQNQAINQTLKALEKFDNAVIRIGEILVIKTTDSNGKSSLLVESISPELAAELASNPEFLRDPQSVKAFLQQEQVRVS